MREPYTQIYLHLVWATLRRAPLLSGEVEALVFKTLQSECAQLRALPIAIGGTEDHVHILVRIPTSLTVGKLAQQLKGVSSHLVNQLSSGKHLQWQGGYGVFSVSKGNVPAVAAYIRNQKEHHRSGRTNPGLEATPDL